MAALNRVSLILIATLWLSVSGARAADSSMPLNLLIITADDMNADSGGWNGSTLGAIAGMQGRP